MRLPRRKCAETGTLVAKTAWARGFCESGQSVRETKGEKEEAMGSKKILLVDDSSTARLVTRLIFSQKSNYVLLSAVDGKDAVERAQAEKPDLILMDVMMPRIDRTRSMPCAEARQTDQQDPGDPPDHARRRAIRSGRLRKWR